MDHFGIGAALQGAARIYIHSARQTGRTTSLVESVKNGDRIVFLNRNEAERVRRLCSERGITVECVIVDPKYPESIFSRSTSEGRTIFDHTWVEQFYLNALERASLDIDMLQREASGFGQAHIATVRAAHEIKSWGY